MELGTQRWPELISSFSLRPSEALSSGVLRGHLGLRRKELLAPPAPLVYSHPSCEDESEAPKSPIPMVRI